MFVVVTQARDKHVFLTPSRTCEFLVPQEDCYLKNCFLRLPLSPPPSSLEMHVALHGIFSPIKNILTFNISAEDIRFQYIIIRGNFCNRYK